MAVNTRLDSRLGMKVHVHVREKSFVVHCGEGEQDVRWLCMVGVARFDPSFGDETGDPVGLRLEDGTVLDMGGSVAETLEEGTHTWVILDEPTSSPSLPPSLQ